MTRQRVVCAVAIFLVAILAAGADEARVLKRYGLFIHLGWVSPGYSLLCQQGWFWPCLGKLPV